MRTDDKQFEALKNLAAITGELSALGWHSLSDRIAENMDALIEQSGYSAEEVFGIPVKTLAA